MSALGTPAAPGTIGLSATYNDLPQIFAAGHTYAPEALYEFRGGRWRFTPNADVLRDVQCYATGVDALSLSQYLAYVTFSPRNLPRTVKTCDHTSFQSFHQAVLVQLILRKLMTTTDPPATAPSAA